MEKITIALTLCFGITTFGQVGFNTPAPEATVDITAKNSTGTTSSPEGLLLPRVDRQRAQSMTGVKTSTLIYVENISTGTQTGTAINIDNPGYYYFNGSVWTKLITGGSSDNIYTANGTLTGNRVVTQNANTLAFTGTAVNAFSVDGSTFSVDAANHRVGIGTTTPQNRLHLGSDAPSAVTDPLGKKLALYNNDNFTSFYGLGVSANRLQFHASSKSDEAPAMVLTNNKNVGIGTTDPNSSAILELSSTNRGFLPPRMTTAQRDALNPKPAGIMIYNTSVNIMQYWNGSSWQNYQ
ncbi:hypothetical protein [Chryseobacterium sp. MMS23-Vi53]|uniref:hypothetical protein n=1 Tax=Chryseobacterium sp. MMS23-Vi53 TaxID=3386644 RepID=UPI0039EBAEFA